MPSNLQASEPQEGEKKSVKLGYWGVRGLGQICRVLLFTSGVNFEDHIYSNYDDWFKKDKINLGLDFPNLPYLIEGDFKLTESIAIYKYIIKRWGNRDLLGKTLEDRARLDCFESVFL